MVGRSPSSMIVLPWRGARRDGVHAAETQLLLEAGLCHSGAHVPSVGTPSGRPATVKDEYKGTEEPARRL